MRINWTLVLIVLVAALAAAIVGSAAVAIDRLAEHVAQPESAVDIILRGRAAETDGGIWLTAFAVLVVASTAVWRVVQLRFKTDLLRQQRLSRRKRPRLRTVSHPPQAPLITRHPTGPALPAPNGGHDAQDTWE